MDRHLVEVHGEKETAEARAAEIQDEGRGKTDVTHGVEGWVVWLTPPRFQKVRVILEGVVEYPDQTLESRSQARRQARNRIDSRVAEVGFSVVAVLDVLEAERKK